MLQEKLLKEGNEHRYIEREKMNHVYVGLPIKEARVDIQELIEEGLLTTTSDGYVLTHRGKFFGNNVFQSFLIDENQNEI